MSHSCPSISEKQVRQLGLVEREKVIVYQDEDEWTGEVCFDPELPRQYQWYVQIFTETRRLNPEYAGEP
jgi:hypothetical protein